MEHPWDGKKMVPLVECSIYPIFGKTSQLRIKRDKNKKKDQKEKFCKSFLVDSTIVNQIKKYTSRFQPKQFLIEAFFKFFDNSFPSKIDIFIL